LHDSVRIENGGIPAVAVATDVFRAAARAQASALGRPDFDAVYVPHPIQDQLPAEIEQRADAVVATIIARLTGNSVSEPSPA
jgi:hypothetical protein